MPVPIWCEQQQTNIQWTIHRLLPTQTGLHVHNGDKIYNTNTGDIQTKCSQPSGYSDRMSSRQAVDIVVVVIAT